MLPISGRMSATKTISPAQLFSEPLMKATPVLSLFVKSALKCTTQQRNLGVGTKNYAIPRFLCLVVHFKADVTNNLRMGVAFIKLECEQAKIFSKGQATRVKKEDMDAL